MKHGEHDHQTGTGAPISRRHENCSDHDGSPRTCLCSLACVRRLHAAETTRREEAKSCASSESPTAPSCFSNNRAFERCVGAVRRQPSARHGRSLNDARKRENYDNLSDLRRRQRKSYSALGPRRPGVPLTTALSLGRNQRSRTATAGVWTCPGCIGRTGDGTICTPWTGRWGRGSPSCPLRRCLGAWPGRAAESGRLLRQGPQRRSWSPPLPRWAWGACSCSA